VEQQQDDDRLVTRGEVRSLRKEVKYWIIIGLVGGQTLSQVALALIAAQTSAVPEGTKYFGVFAWLPGIF
jgi:hypothetical protein